MGQVQPGASVAIYLSGIVLGHQESGGEPPRGEAHPVTLCSEQSVGSHTGQSQNADEVSRQRNFRCLRRPSGQTTGTRAADGPAESLQAATRPAETGDPSTRDAAQLAVLADPAALQQTAETTVPSCHHGDRRVEKGLGSQPSLSICTAYTSTV